MINEEMNIREVIQQKRPFRNSYQMAMVNLIYTNNWVADQLRQHLKPYGVTMKQYNVLRILKGADEPITTSIIRERLLDKMSDASRMVERLHQRDLVIRSVCATDKRLVDVTLSAKGEELLQNMQGLEHRMDAIFEKLSKEDAALLSELLDKLRG